MSFLSLSPELIEQIASYLRPKDLAALMLSCRRFHDVVQGSLLLQYIYRTGPAGVYDPLSDLSTCSIADRMETLRRWEASWADLERSLAVPQLVISIDRDRYGWTFLSSDYLFYVDCQGTWLDQGPSVLLYVDLRNALSTGQYQWKQVDHPQGWVWHTQAFSIEENDLIISAFSSSFSRIDSKIVLQFTSLQTGGPHLLARLPSIQVDTEWFIFSAEMQVDIIGDQIVLIVANMNTEGPQRDLIYLGDWKQGRMTLVHSAPSGTYLGAFAVLRSDLVLFLRRDTPSIEICRLINLRPSPRNASSSSDDGTSSVTSTPTPSLHLLRTLALPTLNPVWRITAANVDTDRQIQRRREPEVSLQDHEWEQECVGLVRAPALSPLPFRSAPEDAVIGIRFTLVDTASNWRSIVMTLGHRALCALAVQEHPPDGCQEDPDSNAGGGAGGLCEGKGRVGQKQEQAMVPWEELGPQATCIALPSPGRPYPSTKHAGQRMFLLESERLVIHDFSAARVRCTRARAHSHLAHVCAHTCEDNNEQKEEAAAAVTETVIEGGSGSFFKDDVASSLPFLKTHVDVPKASDCHILTDGEQLVVFVCRDVVANRITFNVNVLGDNKSQTAAKDPSFESPSSSTPVPSPAGPHTPRSRSCTCGDTSVVANECQCTS